MSKEVIKAILGFAIQLLGKAIPFLGSLMGGPLGWLAGLAVSWLSGLLFDLVERYLRFAKIDKVIDEQVKSAKTATDALRTAQNSATATDAQKEKALADFKAAVRALSRINIVQ